MIDRRNFLAFSGAAIALMLPASASSQVTHYEYSPETLAHFVGTGEPYILNFWASWCVTCASQQRIIGRLQADNPAYKAVPIIRVDWDQEARGELVSRLAIPRRSTLVLMRGQTEIARLVADTREANIQAMLAAAI